MSTASKQFRWTLEIMLWFWYSFGKKRVKREVTRRMMHFRELGAFHCFFSTLLRQWASSQLPFEDSSVFFRADSLLCQSDYFVAFRASSRCCCCLVSHAPERGHYYCKLVWAKRVWTCLVGRVTEWSDKKIAWLPRPRLCFARSEEEAAKILSTNILLGIRM